ncbi:MAG TPA: MFS transporter [Anaerolineales bacterium]|nr:MFS transporter [Anaerolineales bacterium]
MPEPSTRQSTLRSNFLHLYADVFWFGVLFGSTLSFIAVYATRLGASTFQLGLITGGPAILNLLISLPSAHWLQNRNLIRSTFITSIAQRSGYALLVLLPWLVPQAMSEVWAVIAIVLVIALPGTLLAVSFNSMFAEVVPAQYRADVVGRRNALMSLSITFTTFVCGRLLDWIGSPANYQIVFGIGALGAAMSSYHLWRLRPLAVVNSPISNLQSPAATSKKPGRLLRLDLLRGSFGQLVLAYLCFHITQHLNIPINPLFWIKTLQLTDGEIGAGNAMFFATMALGSLALPRLTARYGTRRLLGVSALLYCLYPLILGLAWDYLLFWGASILSGFVWGVCNGCLLNRLMERVPAYDRPAHMAWQNVALNFGILGGSFIGSSMVNWISYREGLLVTAGLRVLSAIVIMLWA